MAAFLLRRQIRASVARVSEPGRKCERLKRHRRSGYHQTAKSRHPRGECHANVGFYGCGGAQPALLASASRRMNSPDQLESRNSTRLLCKAVVPISSLLSPNTAPGAFGYCQQQVPPCSVTLSARCSMGRQRQQGTKALAPALWIEPRDRGHVRPLVRPQFNEIGAPVGVDDEVSLDAGSASPGCGRDAYRRCRFRCRR